MIKARIERNPKTKKQELILTIEMEDTPTISATGKSKVVASTRGNVTLTDVMVEGKPLTVGVNAYIKN